MNRHPSLTDGSLDDVWSLVRARLERRDGDTLGRVRLPPLTSPGRLALGALLGRPPGKTLDLAALEAALARVGVGADLSQALATLGHPVASEPAQRRAERRDAAVARAAARDAAAAWPDEWAGAWIEDVICSGGLARLDADDAVALVGAVRRLLDATDNVAADGHARQSRVDLAARLFGDSHALDTGTRLEAAATRALAFRHSADLADGRNGLWDRAGVHLDLTSAPVLTWRLPVEASAALADLVHAADAAQVPLHLSQYVLRARPIAALTMLDVLVVENPRVVEAAAQRAVDRPVIATSGNPSTAVQLLLTQLLACGARLRYHGDFDAAGLAICSRMAAMGLVPWRMGSGDYLAAINDAKAEGVTLLVDDTAAPPTPWDPPLQRMFDERRLIVHEERLLDQLLE